MSTGNDIVFLPATRPERTAHPRFYPRIITPAEQEIFPSHYLPFDHYVWLCWSIKESAYKFHRRHQPGLRFAPLKFGVNELIRTDDCYFSTVTTGSGSLYARTRIRDGVIVSVVSSDKEFRDTHWGFRSIGDASYATQTSAVRTFALEQLTTVTARSGLHIQKDAAGCPHVLDGDRLLSIPLSLAHHHRYVAWSFNCSYSSSSL